MNRTSPETSTIQPGGNNSPRLADIVARADRMAAELASLAGSPSQAAIVAQIAHTAVTRAFAGVAQ
jgi:hypothetical protein